jgi:hypothetical protein
MSTAFAPQRASAYFGLDTSVVTWSGHTLEPQQDGSAILKGVEIFKAGTFRDSMGEQNTWTVEHLKMMAANFTLLKNAQIFASPPVRRDHSFSIDKVMGYIDNMYVVGDKLVADFNVGDSQAFSKLQRGVYRSVSAEIGMYVSNNETPYWPVVMGVAYVDIPAVEGLHSKQIPVAYFSAHSTQETDPVDPTADDKAPKARMTSFRINGIETTDHAAVATYIENLEKRPATVATFRVNGTETSDYAAVQAHIATLEGFARDTKDNGRKSFVAQLVTDNKIAAPMKESMEALAVGMSDEQFAAFQKSYELAPKMSLTANHGMATGTPDKPAAGTIDPVQDEIDILEAQIQMHRLAGALSEEQIKNTKAFRRLTEIKATKQS